ncbi:Gfo/Idh/MocA family oxidoreductase [Candidatus Chlorohelix sp.]|uniref:Gfo/Idh/MocA family protein n=1 Tax=Candidatus Chlorohelix sp. TaxID=3139201 RepID=UPI0030336C96
MDKIRVGVIGLGNMGERHCRVFNSMAQVNFMGVSDLLEERGHLIQEKYEVPYYSDFHDMLEKVDAVSIATTTPGHFPIGMECLAQGKHLFIEKPIALTVEQAQSLVELAEERKKILMVGHIERYNPAFSELQSLLISRQSEEAVAINIRRLSPFDTSQTDVDVVSDLMIHDLDLVLKMLGRVPDAIETFGRSVFTSTIDHAVATLYYHDGPVISLAASRVTQQKVRAIELTTSESYIETDLLHKSISIHRRFVPFYSNQESPKYRQEGFIERIFVPSSEPLQLELNDFIQSIRTGKKPEVTGQDGLAALALALEIKRKILETSENARATKNVALHAQEFWQHLRISGNPILRMNTSSLSAGN